MRPAVALLIGALGPASAFPSFAHLKHSGGLAYRQNDPHPWTAPGDGDLRAPCPGINTLANHNFINHNGSNITADMLQAGFLAAFNLAYDATSAGATNAINLCTAQLPSGSAPCTEFDLALLRIPHQIEHDASMTREDRGMNNGTGDNYDFSDVAFGETQAVWGSATHIDYGLANKVRLTRIAQQQAVDDPGWFLESDGASLTEHAFYLTTMADPPADLTEDGGNARIEWVEYWWRNERLPTDLGWVKPTATISNSLIASITNAVASAPTPSNSTSATSTTVSSSSSSLVSSSSSLSSSSSSSSPSSSSSLSSAPTSSFAPSSAAVNGTTSYANTTTSLVTSAETSTSPPSTVAVTSTSATPSAVVSTTPTPAPVSSTSTSTESSSSSSTTWYYGGYGPRPSPHSRLPNLYFDFISPSEWKSLAQQFQAWVGTIAQDIGEGIGELESALEADIKEAEEGNW